MKMIWSPVGSARRYRYLLWEFALREIKGRFAGTAAGTLWALINPLATIFVYQFVFSIVLRINVTVEETGTDSFFVFFLSGLFPWILFAESISRSVGCLTQNANLITKVVFPIELLPLSTVVSAFVINGIGMILFLGYLVFAGYIHLTWLFLFYLIPMQVLFSLGLAYILSATCVFIRDIGELIPILIMIGFFCTPIIYLESMVPDAIRPFMAFNPMGIFIDLYRECLLMHKINLPLAGQAFVISMFSYIIGSWYFVRARPAFADVL